MGGQGVEDDAARTLVDAGRALRTGEISAVALLEEVSARADREDASIGSFISRFGGSARTAAERADADLAAGIDRGPLQGIPFGIKDNLATIDGPLTAQSAAFEDSWEAGRDAAAVARLRAAGAVIVGKTTTMEFAIGLPDPSKSFPLPRNPWNLERWAGGSSSGSGSGLAAGFFLGALGTDTAGSIRLPSAFCGITGLKPTFGLVPKSGCVPLGYSYDHVGPMARSAADCAAILDAIAGPAADDPFSIVGPGGGYAGGMDGSLNGVVIGVDRLEGTATPSDPALGRRLTEALAALEAAGARLVEVKVPLYAELTTTTMIGELAEAFAFHRQRLRERWEDYGPATRLTIAIGALVSGGDYVQAQRVRRAGQRAMAELFGEVDLVVTPTASIGAQALEGLAFDEIIDALHTPIWDAVGNPAMSVPIGPAVDGLPLAMQIVGPALGDRAVLQAGDAFQQRTDWHLARPPALTPPAGAAAPVAAEGELATGAGMQVDPAELARAQGLFDAAGLPASAAEVAAAAAGLAGLGAAVDGLYRVPEAELSDPTLLFRSELPTESSGVRRNSNPL